MVRWQTYCRKHKTIPLKINTREQILLLKQKSITDRVTLLQTVMQIYILSASLSFSFCFQCCDTALIHSAPDTGSELRLTQITGAQTCLVSGCTPGNNSYVSCFRNKKRGVREWTGAKKKWESVKLWNNSVSQHLRCLQMSNSQG